MTKSMRDRIRERMDDLNLNARQAALRAGLSKDTVRDILVGRNKNPSTATLSALAIVLECDVAFLSGTQESTLISGGLNEPDTEVPVVGTVNAGVFTEMSGAEPWLSDEEFETIRAPKNYRYPSSRCFAFRVVGDSMNNARPRPILEGDLVLCVDVVDAQIGITDDKVYVVRRTRDGGQTFEWTLKRARVFSNRTELVPESTNAKHKAFVIPRNSHADGGEEIAVIGLMYALFAPF